MNSTYVSLVPLAINIVLVAIATIILVRYRNKEYEVSLYKKQLDAAESLVEHCSKYTEMIVGEVNKGYAELFNRKDFGKITTTDYFDVHEAVAIKVGEQHTKAFNQALKYALLLPEPVVVEVLQFFEETYDLLSDDDEEILTETITGECYEILTELIDAAREELHVDSLSTKTREKIASVGSKNGSKKGK